MAKKYFAKELASTPFLINGIKVNFEIFADDTGGIVLDDTNPADSAIITGLDFAAGKKIGGIISVDEAGYEELKKKVSLRKSVKPQKEVLRVLNPPLKPKQTPFEPPSPPESVAAVNQVAAPAPVDTAEPESPKAEKAPKTFKPRTKKVDVEAPATA